MFLNRKGGAEAYLFLFSPKKVPSPPLFFNCLPDMTLIFPGQNRKITTLPHPNPPLFQAYFPWDFLVTLKMSFKKLLLVVSFCYMNKDHQGIGLLQQWVTKLINFLQTQKQFVLKNNSKRNCQRANKK